MNPYYQDEWVTLYHGDCREVREWLSADVLAMDPPYGIKWRKGEWVNNGTSRSHDGIENDESTEARDWALAEWGARPALSFGSLYAPFPDGLRHLLIWEKPMDAGVIGSTTGYRRDVEAVFMCGDWPKRGAAWGSVLRSAIGSVGNPYSPAGRTGHPHAKPVDLMCRLLERAPLGIVADPFAGSGSTLVAVKALGRNAIGVELKEQYCEVAALRLSQNVLALGGAA
jgi:site-specific DNA-methyltransferase (adenine-specific)